MSQHTQFILPILLGLLVIGIIIAIVLCMHHKDKYSPGPPPEAGAKLRGEGKDKYGPGNLGATGKGCCSLGNQSVCSQGNYYDKAAGCNAKGVSNPSYEAPQVPGGCICNGQGVCAKTGTDSGTCTCQFTNTDANSPTGRVGTANGLTSADACQQCPAGTKVSNACQYGKGIPCAEWNANGTYTCSGSGYTSPCTISSASGILLNTACETPPPPPIAENPLLCAWNTAYPGADGFYFISPDVPGHERCWPPLCTDGDCDLKTGACETCSYGTTLPNKPPVQAGAATTCIRDHSTSTGNC
jgi:hypothetical protein